MSDIQLRQLLGNDAYLAQKNQSRYAPPPQENATNPDLDELDRQLLERNAAPPTQGESQEAPEGGSLEDLDREFEEKASSPVKRGAKQLLQGALSSPAELGGGLLDVGSAAVELGTQKSQDYGTGAKWAKKYGVPEEPKNPTWYERIARAEGTGLPITALGTYLGGPVGGIATAAGIGANALAEPYIASLASKLPYHTGPAAQIAAGALLGRKVGKVTGGALAKKPITPTEQDFRDSAHDHYGHVDNSGITLEPNLAANETANKTLAKLGPGADITSPKTVALTKLLQPDPNGAPTDIRQVTATYRALGDVKPPIGKPKGDADYRAAQIARQDIKDYLDNIPKTAPYSVVSGHANIPDMYQHWLDGNGDWAAAERIGTVNRRFEAGMAQAGSTYSGGNAFNAIRQKFRPLVDPLRFNRQFNQEETDFLKQHMVHGTLPQNTLRMLSKVAPNSAFGMWGNMYAGLQAVGGNPQALALTGLSLASGVAQKAAKAAQKAKLQEFRTLTASRAPLFKKLNPGFAKDEHEIGAGTAGGIGGISEALEEAVPEYIHEGLDISKEAGGVESDDEKKKKEEGGGYSGLANRLHFATNMAMGRMKRGGGYMPMKDETQYTFRPQGHPIENANPGDFGWTTKNIPPVIDYNNIIQRQLEGLPGRAPYRGGYDQPTENFADPEALRLAMARQAARPGIGGYGGSPGAPMGQGGYNRLAGNVPMPRGGYDDTRLPVSTNMVDRRPYNETGLHWPWTLRKIDRELYPQGDPVFTAPMIPPPVYTGKLGAAAGINDIPGPAPTVGATGPMNVGGYDGITGFLDRMAAPIVAEHQQPWTPQRAMGVLGQALGMAGPMEGLGSGGGAGEALAAPSLQNAIRPTQYGAGRSPQITTPQYSTKKGDRLPTTSVPWPQVGGYDGEPSIGDQAMTEVAINRAAGTTPRGILQSVLSPTAQGIGQNIGMAMSPIEAYHGSPYDFNAFDSSKIGTGEGAQMFGYGHYLAENEGVAKSYKPSGVNDRDWDVGDTGLKLPGWIAAGIKHQGKPISQFRDNFVQRLADSKEAMKTSLQPWMEEDAQGHIQGVIDALNAAEKGAEIKQPGKMYQVEIGSEPEHFLDWDSQLSADHPVRQRIQELAQMGLDTHEYGADRNLAKDAFLAAQNPNLTGEGAYKALVNAITPARQALKAAGNPRALFGDPAPMASDELSKLGIPGIRYLDQGSRGTGQGTHNYVVFDPSIIKIMRKYGILGPVSLAGASGATQKRRDGGYNDAAGGGTVQDSTTMFGGYRSKRGWGARRGGYGMSQVSPLAGGSSF